MIRYLIILCIAFCTVFKCNAQQFVGKHKDEVKQIMNSERKDLHIDESSRNTVYNLLKYVDRNNTQTLYYVFDENDTCKFYKTIYDYTYLRQVERELNNKYNRSSAGNWYFVENNNRYQVTLKKDKWYFSVLIKKVHELN
jgi:hypothetical protein